MSAWEYKVVPAPTKGVKARGVKSPEDRFAYALENLMNDMAGEGWEFQRAETLPSIERSGLTGSTTEWRNMLVFRRAKDFAEDAFEHELLPAPEPSVDAEPDPAVVAASLQKRDAPDVPEVTGQSTDSTDEFELEKTADIRKASTQASVETKQRTQPATNKQQDQSGQERDTKNPKTLLENDLDSLETSEGMPTSLKTTFTQASKAKSKD